MLKSFRGGFSYIVCAVLAASLTVSADGRSEVYVVSSNLYADAHYMSTIGDRTFSSPEILHPGRHPNINVIINWSYANGLGDFDNDGDHDYITAIGFLSKHIYISNKADVGSSFAEPEFAGVFGTLEGEFAYDFAVADFNEDGFDDFVLSLGNTTSSELFINTTSISQDTGEVIFEFRSELLPDTAAFDSTGADAADFNGDGHADFVVVPNSAEQFFVNLGDGDPDDDGHVIFTTSSFDTCADCGGASGVAAADFTGDGIVDIAVASSDNLDLYVGDANNIKPGAAIKFDYRSGHTLPPGSSAIDNYDFDGDGIQDLVVASQAGVAVLWGDESGSFHHDGTYFGSTDYDRNAVSAPPWVPQVVKNLEPVAVIEPAYLEATVGEEIVFDGSKSFDEDGQVASYEWDFGDGASNAGILTLSSTKDAGNNNEIKPTHVYFSSGVYPVTLVVTDDRGAKSTVQAEVLVAAVPARVKFLPRSLNLKSRGKWITATFKLPEGYDPNKVDPASVSVTTKDSDRIFAKPLHRRSFLAKLWRKIQHRFKVVTVRFDRQAVIRAIKSPSKETSLILEGKLLRNNGRKVEFEGSGKIRTYEKKSKWSFWKKYISKKK